MRAELTWIKEFVAGMFRISFLFFRSKVFVKRSLPAEMFFFFFFFIKMNYLLTFVSIQSMKKKAPVVANDLS